MMTRIMPSAITGSDFLTEVEIVVRYEPGGGGAFGPFRRVETPGGGLDE